MGRGSVQSCRIRIDSRYDTGVARAAISATLFDRMNRFENPLPRPPHPHTTPDGNAIDIAWIVDMRAHWLLARWSDTDLMRLHVRDRPDD